MKYIFILTGGKTFFSKKKNLSTRLSDLGSNFSKFSDEACPQTPWPVVESRSSMILGHETTFLPSWHAVFREPTFVLMLLYVKLNVNLIPSYESLYIIYDVWCTIEITICLVCTTLYTRQYLRDQCPMTIYSTFNV